MEKTHKRKPILISSPKNTYAVEKKLGRGSFGTVIQCKQFPACEPVAVKIVTNRNYGKREAEMLKKLKALDADKHNILKFLEPFTHDSNYYFVFELLDVSISKFLYNRNWKPFCATEIRPVAQQMLVALRALKSVSVVHTDIKPDNIMLVNQAAFPFKAKLIDFGLARDKSALVPGKIIQPIGYRAPEVVLGLPMDEGVDMWSLGCVLASMYIGRHLYPTHCQYELIRAIDQMQGSLPEDVLKTALRGEDFYTFPKNSTDRKLRLNTPREYTQATGQYTLQRNSVYQICPTLNDLPNLHSLDRSYFDAEDTNEFMSLLKQMLSVDKNSRFSPEQALDHSFITMAHLLERKDEPYVMKALKNVRQVTDGKHFRAHSTTPSTSTKKPHFKKPNEGSAERHPSLQNEKQEAVVDTSSYFPAASKISRKSDSNNEHQGSAVGEKKLPTPLDEKTSAITNNTPQPQETSDEEARAEVEEITNTRAPTRHTHKKKQRKSSFIEMKARRTFFKRVQLFISKYLTGLCHYAR